MTTINLGETTVLLYSSIKELPIHLSKKFNEQILKDSGIGNTIEDVDDHLGRLMAFVNSDQKDDVIEELKNLRYNLFSMLSGIDYKSLAFACLIAKVDGKTVEDYESEGLAKLIEDLSRKGLNNEKVAETIEEVKKNWIRSENITSPLSSLPT